MSETNDITRKRPYSGKGAHIKRTSQKHFSFCNISHTDPLPDLITVSILVWGNFPRLFASFMSMSLKLLKTLKSFSYGCGLFLLTSVSLFTLHMSFTLLYLGLSFFCFVFVWVAYPPSYQRKSLAAVFFCVVAGDVGVAVAGSVVIADVAIVRVVASYFGDKTNGSGNICLKIVICKVSLVESKDA